MMNRLVVITNVEIQNGVGTDAPSSSTIIRNNRQTDAIFIVE